MLVISQEVTMKQITFLFRFEFIVTLMKKLVLFLILLCLWPVLANATVYYVANAGNDSCNGTSSSLGSSGACAWQSIAHVNAHKFNSGDSILFQSGGTWREQLTVPSSGSAGSPITFGSYGSGALPVINGANLLSSGWIQTQSNIWQVNVTTQPKQIFFNGVRGTLVASAGAIASANQWFWAANVLYVYSTSNPATAFTSPGIEAGTNTYNIETNGNSYLTFNNLHLTESNGYGMIFHIANASYLIVNGLTVDHAYLEGIANGGANRVTNVTIENSTVSWCGASGIDIASTPASYWTIQNNVVNNNCQVDIADNGIFQYCGGIKSFAGNALNTYTLITGNIVYSQGKRPSGSRVVNPTAAGIWLDTFVNTSYANGAVVTKNNVYDNQTAGIFIENGSYSTVAYNLVYNNTSGSDTYGIRVSDWHNISPTNYNRVYNNVIYGNEIGGIDVSGSQGSEANRCIGNEVKNNIIVGNATAPNPNQLVAEFGGENDGTMGSGNVYLNNALGPEQSHFIRWGNTTNKNTYAAWYAAYPAANGHTVKGDPLFVSTSIPDFHLQPTSPAINAGVNVGLTTDYAGNPVHNPPSIGAYEYGETILAPPQNLRLGGQ
jgi:hypothetical protein